MAKPRILVNMFHPNYAKSRGTRALADAVQSAPNLTFRDVYAECPNGVIDVKREQDLLISHDLIVFQHPFYWYSSPSLFKEWQDRVLEMGFAYPPGVGDKLNGKHWQSVITTGGPELAYRSGAYNHFSISELMRPFEQTANLCGMIWHPVFVVHSVLPPGIAGFKSVSDDDLQKRGQDYRAMLEAYDF